jgi:superfamily II DNA or RNA helicase
MTYLGKRGYTIYKECLDEKDISIIKNDLTVKPHSSHLASNIESFPIFRESDTKIYLPRYYGIEYYGMYEKSLITNGITIDCPFKGDLRDYQNKIVDKFIKHVGNSGGGLLDVEPGKGKTVMGLNIISKLKRKTLVVVHKSFLVNQWIERINQFIPNAKVGKIQGSVIDVEDKDIVIGMIQSLCSKQYDSNIWDDFGFTIFDECHHLSAEMFMKVMIKIITTYTLGLSGTMTRKDGLSKVFKYFIGNVIHKEKSDLSVNVLIKSIAFKSSDEEYNKDILDFRGMVQYSSMINKLCDYQPRTEFINQVLINELKLNPNQQIMILSQNKSLINNLHVIIKEHEPSVGFYIGGMKEAALKENETKKIILATYSMASEGLDIKTLTTLFMITPKTDICQSVGRILRSKHAKPMVIDIVDSHSVFKNQYKKRCKYYNKKKYEIEKYDDQYCYLKNETMNIKKQSKCLFEI